MNGPIMNFVEIIRTWSYRKDLLNLGFEAGYEAGLREAERALKAVQARRNRIDEALGYEFVGEYIDSVLNQME